MKSLKALTEHLRSLKLTDEDCFDSWVEKGELEPRNAVLTAGFDAPVSLFGSIPYTAVLDWENWHGSAYDLFFHVMQWLYEHDYDFDAMGNPTFSAVVPDDEVANVQITIRFVELIYESGGRRVDAPTPNTIDDIAVICNHAAH